MKLLRIILFVPLALLFLVSAVLAMASPTAWLVIVALVSGGSAVAVLQTEAGIIFGIIALVLFLAVIVHFGRSFTFAH